MSKSLRSALFRCGVALTFALPTASFAAPARPASVTKSPAAPQDSNRTVKRRAFRLRAAKRKTVRHKVDYIPPSGGRPFCTELPPRPARVPLLMLTPALDEEPPVMPRPTPRP